MYFHELTEAQVLAVAIAAEEEDGHIFRDFAHALRADFPATADLFMKMAQEESNHRSRLIELYQKRFGDHIPLIRREDVKGFIKRPPFLFAKINPERARTEAALMELQARRFYEAAAVRCSDASLRKLLGDLAQEEQQHERSALEVTQEQLATGVLHEEKRASRRFFVLRFVQPGLAGLMDGSVSTLAPIFAAALATMNTLTTLKVGLAASIGAGISMGFAEALSDDGRISGRGSPLLRGMISGAMTALGGLGHTLPFFLRDFHLAMEVAIAVVVFELIAISLIRWRFMDTPFLSAAFQVIVGGFLVFLVGWFVGAV